MHSELVRTMLAMGPMADQLDGLTDEEMAAVAEDWSMWARPDQVLPEPFSLLMFYQARASGKTRAIAEYVHREAMSGRANRIVMCAQTLDDTIGIMVTGDSGLLQVAPPWEMPELHGRELHWPSGAVGYLKTAESPEKRGPQYHLFWASEIISWKRTKAMEVWTNLQLSTRLGYARTIVDTTPRKSSPIVKEIRRMAEIFPDMVKIVGGKTRDNEINLSEGKVDMWEATWGGTKRGKEELEGLDADDDGLIDSDWIDDNRRREPTMYARRIVSLDPATTDRRGSHNTGLVELGLGTDKQIYSIADHTSHMSPDEWAAKSIKLYLDGRCDCLVVETNRGGQLVTGILRASAKDKGQQLQVLDQKATTRHSPGTVYVKEVFARTSKERRADAAVVLYKAGRVSHVIGAELDRLEETLTTWIDEPGAVSPGDLDSLVWGLIELSGLYSIDISSDMGASALASLRKNLSAAKARRQPSVGGLIGRRGRSSSRI